MQKTVQRPTTESPFFNLLADADEVQIREVSTDKDPKELRTFYVHIKTPPPAPKPAATEKTPYESDHLLQSAELLLENSDYLLARNVYSYLLQQNLRDAAALRGLGICLFRLGEVVSSRKCFRALTELFKSQEAEYWMAIGYLAEGKDPIAASHFDKIGNPETLKVDIRFDFHKNYGNCLTRLGLLDRAQAQYLKALELVPTSDTIHVNLGTLLIQRHEWQQAAARFTRALELNPNSGKAECGLGLTSLAQNDTTRAKKHFNRSLDLDCQNLVALHQLLELTSSSDELTAIKGRLRSFLEKEPNHADSHYALAVLLFKEGSWKLCEMHAARALEIDPRHARAMKLRSDLTSLVTK